MQEVISLNVITVYLKKKINFLHILLYNNMSVISLLYIRREEQDMVHIQNHATCPECDTQIDEKSYILECEYCLSKKQD